jgi:hypothetical protein
LAEFLGTRTGQTPPEYLRYRLRLMYRCPPSALAEQTGEHFFEMLNDLMCQQWEAKTEKFRRDLHG